MKLAILPRLDDVLRGPGSFQRALRRGLEARGHSIAAEPREPGVDALLVVSGTRHLDEILRARRRGLPVVQRLDGINWMHRRIPASARYRLRAELRNGLVRTIRARLADHVVYQSAFVRALWEERFGAAPVPHSVIPNGVDLERFSPTGAREVGSAGRRLLAVEGAYGPARLTLDIPLALHAALAGDAPGELLLVGEMPERWRAELENRPDVQVLGVVAPERVAALQRGADLFVSSELLAPCPNAVLEAMACGTPVVGYREGALAELVGTEAGITVPFGADPWKLERPDTPALAGAARRILARREAFAAGARARVERELGLDRMVERYLDVLGALVGARGGAAA